MDPRAEVILQYQTHLGQHFALSYGSVQVSTDLVKGDFLQLSRSLNSRVAQERDLGHWFQETGLCFCPDSSV